MSDDDLMALAEKTSKGDLAATLSEYTRLEAQRARAK
jgi:hypothetical protein